MAFDPYEAFLRKIDPTRAMEAKTLPLGAAGEQAPGFPTQLAQTLLQQGQQKQEQDTKQKDLMMNLAEKVAIAKSRQKQDSALDMQLKQARIDSIKQKMSGNPLAQRMLTAYTALNNRVAADEAAGNDTTENRNKLAAIEKEYFPQWGLTREEVPGVVSTWAGFGNPEKITKVIYDAENAAKAPATKMAKKTEGQTTHAQPQLTPMTPVEREKVAKARQMGKSEEEIKAAVIKDGFAWEP